MCMKHLRYVYLNVSILAHRSFLYHFHSFVHMLCALMFGLAIMICKKKCRVIKGHQNNEIRENSYHATLMDF